MQINDNRTKNTLASFYGKKGVLVILIIAASFIFNVLALLTPFTSFGSLFSRTLSCSLPYSVHLMWNESLYVIAILVILFSILFPFVKLYCLIYVWCIGKNKNKRNTVLKIVEPLGKWSMLDVFATCIVLILCNKQILIYGSPKIGVDFFLLAIFLSIIGSIIIDQLHDSRFKEKDCNYIDNNKSSIFSSFWYNLFVVIGLFVSLIILIVAIIYPYLKITSFLLISYSYSIFDSVIALANISLVLSIFMLLTMIAFPILHNVSLLLCYILKLFMKKEYPMLARFIKIFSRFNMLDVFMLGFVIFLVEGESMVEIEHRVGIVLIALFLFIVLVIPQIIIAIRKTLYYYRKKQKYD